MAKPTQTTNRLHFSDLDATRFEDLSLAMVYRIHNWERINHDGRTGSDEGADIRAVRVNESGVKEHWAVQCKRYSNFSAASAQKVVDEVVQKNTGKITVLLVIVGCNVTRATRVELERYATEKGIEKTMLWSASELEARLYSDYQDILFTYFGISNQLLANHEPHPSDVKLLKEFRKLIGPNESLFLETHEFAAGAHQRHLEPFGILYDSWRGAHFEFQDEEINVIFTELLNANYEFMESTVTHLYPGNDSSKTLTAKTDEDRAYGLTQTTREGIKLMNQSAQKLWKILQDFERFAKKKIRTS